MDWCLLIWGYLEVLVSKIEIPTVWEVPVWPLHCRSEDVSLGRPAAGELVFPMDLNLLNNVIPPHHTAGLTKPIPDVYCRVEEDCFKPTELGILSLLPAQACQEDFLQHSTAICDDSEQSMVLGCLEKRTGLGQICTSFSLGSDVLRDLAFSFPVLLSRFACVFW